MRLNVTKVLSRLENQFEKSSMLDESIRLIYLVMHSNDCIARALTLRSNFLLLFGKMFVRVRTIRFSFLFQNFSDFVANLSR